LVALGPGAPGGNHNVRLFAFNALQAGDCEETVNQGKFGTAQERSLYRGVGSACLAAFASRPDLWSQAESDFNSFDSAGFDFTCYDRAAFSVFDAVISAHRQDPDRNFVRAQGATTADSCPRMAEVHPDHGSVDGGYEVTIIGENFPAETTVWIQNTSVDVQSQDAGRRLTFTMPAIEEPGSAFLIVQGGGSDTGLEFTFEESSAAGQSPTDQASDPNNTDSTNDSDATTEPPEETVPSNEPTDQPTDATDEPS
jgi:IPT/TIG domain